MAAGITGTTLTPRSAGWEKLHVDGARGVAIEGTKVTLADIASSNGVIYVMTVRWSRKADNAQVSLRK